ncbi:MAG: peptide-methionine (S)-S-oxide reductase MsrA [Planctomycetota bacterium]
MNDPERVRLASRRWLPAALLLAATVAVGLLAFPRASQQASASESTGVAPTTSPRFRVMPSTNDSSATATFGGGCFWCTEAVFEATRGVSAAVSGYAGGATENPTYQAICTGTTGHAEVVQVTYDPSVVGYEQLLEVFFRTHDPTTLNRQGADVGTQYRSVVYYHDEAQREAAEGVKRRLEESGAFSGPIVTEISPLPTFYPAEDYHQDYFAQNPTQGYCRAVIAPKMDKYRKAFAGLLK